MPTQKTHNEVIIYLFTDTAAILISIVSNSHYGMPRGQIHINLPPGHPIMAIRNNRNQNGRRIGKKVYCSTWTRRITIILQGKFTFCLIFNFHSTVAAGETGTKHKEKWNVKWNRDSRNFQIFEKKNNPWGWPKFSKHSISFASVPEFLEFWFNGKLS